MIEETPCVLVSAARRLHLVLRGDGRPPDPPFPGTNIVCLVKGDATFDFLWSSACVSASAGPGVAGAMAARLFGDVLGEPVLRGLDIGSGQEFNFQAPRDWWHGAWSVRQRRHPEVVRTVRARLLFHGDLVLS